MIGGSVKLSTMLASIAVDPFTHSVAVSTQSSLTMVDTRTDTVSSTFDLPVAANRATGADVLSHTFFVRVSDSMVWTFHDGTTDRLPADNVGAIGVDFLLHKVYTANWNRSSVSVLNEWKATGP